MRRMVFQIDPHIMSMSTCVTSSAYSADNRSCTYWQHRQEATPEFDHRLFTDAWLEEQGWIVSSPSAGRGASHFLNIRQVELVLRHYRRGGMVRKLSEQSYLWFGLNRTRAWREFAVLCDLEAKSLPAPKPYACQVHKQGLRYSASLITYYVVGTTLAEHVVTAVLADEQWRAVGRCIRDFHDAGVYHADLNAHNILLHDGVVTIIDFDRAVIDVSIGPRKFEKNLQRLQRSLKKIIRTGAGFYNEDCWAALKLGYVQT